MEFDIRVWCNENEILTKDAFEGCIGKKMSLRGVGEGTIIDARVELDGASATITLDVPKIDINSDGRFSIMPIDLIN